MRYRRVHVQPLEPWEELEQRMCSPVRAIDTELIDSAPRDVVALRALGARTLNRLGESLRIAAKPDGLTPQKEHPKMWRERARFLAETDHEKARLVLIALQERDRRT